MKDQLKEFPVVTTIKVRWGEMDAANHVNNVLYFRWAEAARFDYFEQLDIPVVPDDKGIGFVLGWQDCKYIIPVVYPDTIHLGTRSKQFEKDRFIMETYFYSEKYQKLVAIAQHRIVCFNYTDRKKADIPTEVKQKILDYEQSFKEST